MPAEPIEGLRALQRKLFELRDLDRGKVLRSATLLATTPVMQAAKARIPVSDRSYLAKTYKGRKVAPGFAQRNLARKVILARNKNRAFGLVGVKPEAYYALLFVELGTSKQPKQPWLEPAFRGTQSAQITAFGDTIRRKLMIIARKNGRR